MESLVKAIAICTTLLFC